MESTHHVNFCWKKILPAFLQLRKLVCRLIFACEQRVQKLCEIGHSSAEYVKLLCFFIYNYAKPMSGTSESEAMYDEN
jgi:hypothetical protein